MLFLLLGLLPSAGCGSNAEPAADPPVSVAAAEENRPAEESTTEPPADGLPHQDPGALAGTAEQPDRLMTADERQQLWAQVEAAAGRGDWESALPDAEEVIRQEEAVLGRHNPAVIAKQRTLAAWLEWIHAWPQACRIRDEIAVLLTEIHGANDYRVRDARLAREHIDRLAVLSTADHDALQHTRRIAAIVEQLYAAGRYGEALSKSQDIAKIRGRILGVEHPDYASSLNNLAELYRAMGEYARAEPLYRQASEILKTVLGEHHPQYAQSLNSLAFLYQTMGEYARAEPLHRQALEIKKKALGEQHPDYASSLDHLAGLYDSMGEYARAEPLYRQASEIRKTVLGEEHLTYGKSLNNLAALYQAMGEYARAGPLQRQASEILKTVLGEEHPDYASSLNNLAFLYQAMGECAQAEPLHRQALEIKKKALGEQHPDYAQSLYNLAELYRVMGEYARAEPLAAEALKRRLEIGETVLPALSAARVQGFLESNHVAHHWLLSVLRRLTQPDPLQAHTAMWRTRGLLTQQQLDQRALPEDSGEATPLWQELRNVQQQLAQLTLAKVAPDQAATRQQRLSELNNRKEELEGSLGRLSAVFRRTRQVQQAEPGDLAGVLESDTAVVEIVQSLVWPERKENEPEPDPVVHYDAFVLRPDDSERGYRVDWIELGSVEPVDEAATAWLAAIGRPAGRGQVTPLDARGTGQKASPEQQLRELVWAKLEPHLEGAQTLVIIPDGSLTRIPWAALPGKQPDAFLLEDYAIATCSNGRQLYAALTAPEPEADNLLLLGDVAYDAERTAVNAPLQASDEGAFRSPAPTGDRTNWGPLPGTKRELEQIRRLSMEAAQVTALAGSEASEFRLRQTLPTSRFIHLATHGFFANESFRSWLQHDTGGEQLFGGLHSGRSQATVTGRNPLILSGVVLAGANQPAATDELGLPTGQDGILTAEEIVSLDLRNAELVVLSACETGLGAVAGGEGVMGLQRAFHLAGARTTIASLWKVDDAATQTLMVEFYRNLWKKKFSRLESLRQAQLTMLRSYDPQQRTLRGAVTRIPQKTSDSATTGAGRLPPYYWAAFTLSGDWR